MNPLVFPRQQNIDLVELHEGFPDFGPFFVGQRPCLMRQTTQNKKSQTQRLCYLTMLNRTHFGTTLNMGCVSIFYNLAQF